MNLDQRSHAVREVVWSIAINNTHFSNAILANAVRAADRLTGRNSPDYDRTLIDQAFVFRQRQVERRIAELSRAGRQREARTLRNVVTQYREERSAALDMLDASHEDDEDEEDEG